MKKRELSEGDTVEVCYVRAFGADLWVNARVVSVEADKFGVLLLGGPDEGCYLALERHAQGRTWR